ncbi:Metacaspase-1 [Yarrowia sp. C11]|nr:Metacaspase-1 [Yarrowia sp. C11]KAG5364908.1 Metacaspase-1 [Yarrowia sp. E02]
MSYPGQGGNTYGGGPPGGYGGGYNQGGYGGGGGNYGPPQGPPPGQYGGGYGGQGGNYGPPQGPPPGQYGGNGGHGGYGPPQGPPPGQRGDYGGPPQGQYGNQGGNHGGNGGGYGHPGMPNNAPPGQYGQSGPPGPHGNHNLPPQGNQAFGGAQGYNFQYSNCSGKKKALLIGVNYIGSKNALRGCINDVHNLQRYLVQRAGYKPDDMVILTDDQRDQRSIPTKQNIIQAMQWLVKGAQPNDSLVFHFSGHGGQEKDQDGDEDDGYDECIYPVDFQRAGSIIDDVLHDILVKSLPPGCRLTALFDSCHSGTALDLPYVYSTKGILKEPNLAKEAGQGLLGAVSSYARGDIGGALSSIMGTVKQATTGSGANERAKQTKTAPCDAISISGCKDSQTSADAMEAGTATGAMSFAFIEVMTRDPNQSYLSLLNNMREALRGKYSQKPQLSASHPTDVNLKFIM